MAIEPLAARLQTSKGSFYWYFPNRDALIRAALTRWEQDHTEQVIQLLEQIPDPVRRLRELVRGALLGARGAAVALLLLANADDPLVGEVVHRVTARRLEVLTGCFTALGHPRARLLLAASRPRLRSRPSGRGRATVGLVNRMVHYACSGPQQDSTLGCRLCFC